jgi:hypothetical protein
MGFNSGLKGLKNVNGKMKNHRDKCSDGGCNPLFDGYNPEHDILFRETSTIELQEDAI